MDVIKFYKKINLAIFCTTIIVLSLENASLLSGAIYYYYLTGVPWYEWMYYIFLALGILILPILSLFYLDSIYVRQILRIYLFGIILSMSLVFYEDIWQYRRIMLLNQRPLNSILIFMKIVGSLYSWLFLTRQIRGNHLLPIEISTKNYRLNKNFIKWISSPWNNLKDFLAVQEIQRIKLMYSVLLLIIIIFSGFFVTLLPENSIIRLERPNDHNMKISFWGSAHRFDNSTLDILGNYNTKIYAWGDYRDSDWIRYGERGVEIVLVKGFESDESKRNLDFLQITEMMNYLDVHPELPIVGFTDDMEMFTGISRYNTSYYNSYVNYIQNKTNYVYSRGYEYHITQWLSSINDLRDNDNDVAIVYKNPFDPIKFQNLTSIGWMMYRSEIAILYDEPYDYFTYHWADQVNKYMDFIELKSKLPFGTWKQKSTISIGVTTTSDSLYTFNIILNPNARNQWIQEIKICHAMKMNEVIIFIGGPLEDQDGFMGLVGGNEGLQEIYDILESYQQVEIKYKRRATFFGNLKLWTNFTGSVIGLLYSDLSYDSWTGYFCYIWASLFIFFLSAQKKANVHKESSVSNLEFSRKAIQILKICALGLIILVSFLTIIFFWYSPFFKVLKNIQMFL